MPLLRILHYPDPVLKKMAVPVDCFDDKLRQLAADMAETMYAAPGVGLAAPQVGVSQRLIVLDCSGKEEEPQLVTAVNPRIVSREGELCDEEGCLSVPGYYARVDRAAKVVVDFLDLDGKAQQIECEGLWAVAFQHELDHLDGILFVDHLSPLKKGLFRKKYQRILQQQEEQL
ncbi:MAG: peptide deformylase [Desulfuromonas sp.]|nr:MAG: peptide deformylase [Desulfuromonas sp.]